MPRSARRCGQRSTAPPRPPSRTTGTRSARRTSTSTGRSWTAATVHLSAMFEQVLTELRLAFLLFPAPERLHGPYLARNRRLLELVEAGDDAAVFAELDDYLTCSELNVLRSIEA